MGLKAFQLWALGNLSQMLILQAKGTSWRVFCEEPTQFLLLFFQKTRCHCGAGLELITVLLQPPEGHPMLSNGFFWPLSLCSELQGFLFVSFSYVSCMLCQLPEFYFEKNEPPC